jgi:hypothetical protein
MWVAVGPLFQAVSTQYLTRATMAGNQLQPVQFGDYLIEKKLIDEGQLLDVLADHWMTGRPLGESVVRRGYLTSVEVEKQLKEFESRTIVYV